MEGAELKRLLYVALTRAESHIVVTATQARGEDAKGRSFRSLLAPSLGLFEAPSPLAASRDLPPFGPLTALPSGALAGLIPERSDREYLALVAGAKSRGDRDQSPEPPAYALIERRAWPLSVSVSSLAALHAAQSPAPAQSLEVALELAAPRGLSPETWGSLVHAVLEKRLAADKRELSPALHDALEEGLGAEGSIRGAILRAEALAEVFLRSTLGIRALAARERLVELKVAIGLAAEGGPGRARLARGSIDLAFLEEDRVIVVDYKTDSAMSAGGHDLQVAAYKRAAAEIFGLPAEAWVFYLYGGGKAILVDEEGLAPRLEEAPQAAPNMAASFGLKRT